MIDGRVTIANFIELTDILDGWVSLWHGNVTKAGWWVLLLGAAIAAGGATVICFRIRIAKFFASIPTGRPRTPDAAIFAGSLLVLFGALMIWSAAMQLLSLS
jgi:hypothetical protein